MLFNFYFNESLDFTQFKRQATHYVNIAPNIAYHLFLKNYKLVCEIEKINPIFKIQFSIVQIKRDSDQDIVGGSFVVPLSDIKFQELKDIINSFSPDERVGEYKAENNVAAVDFMCRTVKMLNKIDKLNVFS
jgi:hypothetical protein